jgi:uncharacterized protein (DUF305 family)
MNTTNNTVLIGVGFLVVGIFAGWLIWGNHKPNPMAINGQMHRMPDGTMMVNSGNDMGSMMHDMNAKLQGKTGDEFDKAFLSEMVIHHEGAVDMAKLVLTSSKRPEMIKFANDIISVQSKEIDMMKQWENEWFSKPVSE